MPTVAELKDYCRTHGIKGYSNKNKAQLLQLIAEYQKTQNYEFKSNIFTDVPKVIMSEIGSFLNLKDTTNTAISQKYLGKGEIYKSKKCATIVNPKNVRYNTLVEYYSYKNFIYEQLNILLKQSPKLEYLELDYILDLNNMSKNRTLLSDINNLLDPYKNIEGSHSQTFAKNEIIEILNLINKFKNLQALDIKFNYVFGQFEEGFYDPIFELFGNLKLQFLATDIYFFYAEDLEIITSNPNLRYLELSKLRLEDNIDIPDIKIKTLALLDTNTSDFYFELKSFGNVRHIIFNFIDYLILSDLKNIPNLIALEFNKYSYQESNGYWAIYIKDLPKKIKFFRIEEVDTIYSADGNNFYIAFLQHCENLEYICFDELYLDASLHLLQHTLETLIKYIYVKELHLEYVDDIKYMDKIVRSLKYSGVIYFGFEKLYYDDKFSDELNIFLELGNVFDWKVKKIDNYYILDNPKNTPDDWLKANGLMVRPRCN